MVEDGLEPDFLEWEYTLLAKSDFPWTVTGIPLARAADILWKRADASRRLWESVTATDAIAPLVAQSSFSQDEAKVLNDYGLDRVAVMLLGLAIENVAKTLIVRAAPEAAVKDGNVRHLKSHNLVELLKRAGIAVSDAESAQLDVVQDYVEWLGKYPVPLSAHGKGSPRSTPGAWAEYRSVDPRVAWTSARAVLQRATDKRDEGTVKIPLSNEEL